MPNTEYNAPSEPPGEIQPASYYCRGYGGLLPQGSPARFHPNCLKADKRRRIAERRQREARRLRAWLRRRKCPNCGATLEKVVQVNPRRSVEMACETSQGGAERLNSQARLDCPTNHDRACRAALMRNSILKFFFSGALVIYKRSVQHLADWTVSLRQL